MLNKDRSVQLIVNKEDCIKCKKCVENCHSEYLIFSNNEVCANDKSTFGCIQCGYCMLNCPKNCIEIIADGISKDKITTLPNDYPPFEVLNSLLQKRRSIRKFKNEELPNDIIEKILSAASTAPISIPPSEVKVLVINGVDKVQELAQELTDQYDNFLKILPLLLVVLKPFIKPIQHKLFKEFLKPLAEMTVSRRKNGVDVLFYNAPTLIYFYGSELSEKDDQIIAATHAYIAAESLGLGTCIIGSVPPLLQRNKKLKAKYGISPTDNPGMAFIVGYPAYCFSKGIVREFKEVKYFQN